MRSGFSLVELSIVLVILGLLTGGILAGQSLIRAAELRAGTAQYQKYIAAVHTFRDKYFQIPGDMNNAIKFWGIAGGATGEDNACYVAPSTDMRTCNGNGDGRVLGTNPEYNEYYRFWQQMANAGLIEGSFRGTRGQNLGGAASLVADENAPSSKYGSKFVWWSAYNVGFAGNAMTFAMTAGNQFLLVSPSYEPAFTPSELWNIDIKLDDGRPNFGKLTATKGSAGLPCTTTAGMPVASDTNSEYNVRNESALCTPYYTYQ